MVANTPLSSAAAPSEAGATAVTAATGGTGETAFRFSTLYLGGLLALTLPMPLTPLRVPTEEMSAPPSNPLGEAETST